MDNLAQRAYHAMIDCPCCGGKIGFVWARIAQCDVCSAKFVPVAQYPATVFQSETNVTMVRQKLILEPGEITPDVTSKYPELIASKDAVTFVTFEWEM